MCGIAGSIDKHDNKKDIIKDMCDRIAHRGPDGKGYYVDDYIALGHRRLSIIDLKGGAQPMYSNDDRYVIVFNGEIYNYKDLKKELKYKFNTTCDTEVLIAAYIKWGKDMLTHLRGMFAFAIYDKKEKELFCARDHFGIKPFYYYNDNNCFIFASEIKAFLDHPDFIKEFNEDILPNYLRFSFTPTEETFFKGVYRLDAGCYLTYKNNKLTIKRYYRPTFKPTENGYENAVKEVAKTMEESVKYHMIADVEVGSFLSSGVDSSYLVSLAKPNKTYTASYAIKKYDETSYTEELAKELGITNKKRMIEKDEYMKSIKKIMYHMDEPSSDPAIESLYFVANLASKDVKVVLSGEGADEFFGGYNTYKTALPSAYKKIPFFLRRGAALVGSLFPEMRGINYIVRYGTKLEDRYVGVNPIWEEREVKKILKKKQKIANKDITKPIFDIYKDQNELNKMQGVDLYFWFMKDILQKGDRMTMANSIEGRVPFTDIEVFNVASKLPMNYKVSKTNTKLAMRDASKSVIPTGVSDKKKLGFPVPIRDWIRDEDVYTKIEKAFDTDIAKTYFNTDKLKKMLNDHINKKHDNYRKVWSIYCFIQWYDVFFNKNGEY
ncbi:MAG: asparagine synthase (glutamine-hydrolyzing) [Bacilli bacterium]|nr:asparagine synthase (glutamine-hydrolyzing) [Bacilli bacterium]